MQKDNSDVIRNPEESIFSNHLDEIVRRGARKLLCEAVEMEVESFLESKQYVIDDTLCVNVGETLSCDRLRNVWRD